MIELEGVTKIYQMGLTEVRALDGISLRIDQGEMTAIMGQSGSGKSTLLAILGCLDAPTSGTYRLDGLNVEKMSENAQARVRNVKIGFIFQQFNLLARTSALDNVMLPLTYAGLRGRARRKQAEAALDRVGLADRMHHRPSELSGGQQQRVAIARALANSPAILLADEPTGALDSKTGAEIIGLFQELHRSLGQTVIYVTHDAAIASHTQRIIRLADGRVVSDEPVAQPTVAGSVPPAGLATPNAAIIEPQGLAHEHS